MRSVLISIKPQWCELIANGKKTVEVRKTKPKLETPFKCYIYCTNKRGSAFFTEQNFEKYSIPHLGNGKVIGEFVCDRIIDIPYSQCFVDYYHTMPKDDLEATCLGMGHIDEYLLSNNGYGWHISDLVTYDKPMELSEFRSYNCRVYIDENSYPMPTHEITRPPQSWCYVEEGVSA